LKTGLLRIADNLSVPVDAVTQTIADVGMRGTGKTSTGVVFAEELIRAGQQVVVMDPVGVWWGLRSSADGNGPGLPIAILGGNHGDVPLQHTAGALIADLVVDERLPAVLDMGSWTGGERTRFVTDFAERLYLRKGEQGKADPLMLIMDEADAFAPQRPQQNEMRMLGAMDVIMRRGRVRGLGVMLISQRPAVLNKNVLSQCELLVAHRIIGKIDRKTIEQWVAAHSEDGQIEKLINSIASLDRGEAWFWSPTWLDTFERVQVRRRWTFDSSATPKVGDLRIEPKSFADIDLAALTARMAESVEKAKADDPKLLKQKIQELQRRLESREVERVEVPVVDEKTVEALRDIAGGVFVAVKEFGDELARLDRMRQEACDNFIGELGAVAEHFRTAANPLIQSPVAAAGPLYPLAEAAERTRAEQSEFMNPALGRPMPADHHADAVLMGVCADLTPRQQAIINALAEFSQLGLRWVQQSNVAVFSGASPKSSAFTANLRKLKNDGLIEIRDGLVGLMAAGSQAASRQTSIRSLSDLHAAWLGKFQGFQRAMLSTLIQSYPASVEKPELAEAIGQSITSSSFEANIRALRGFGIVESGAASVGATEMLFPEGLR